MIAALDQARKGIEDFPGSLCLQRGLRVPGPSSAGSARGGMNNWSSVWLTRIKIPDRSRDETKPLIQSDEPTTPMLSSCSPAAIKRSKG